MSPSSGSISRRLLAGLVISAIFLASPGCKERKAATVASKPAAPPYFKTGFQDESQFIVESILTDLAEMASFARNGALPDPASVSVQAQERLHCRFREPVYDVTIILGPGSPPVKAELAIVNAIWSPETYDKVAALFLPRTNAPADAGPEDLSLIKALQDAHPVTLAEQAGTISRMLQGDFKNPALHAKAAFLLGAFALRECSGRFYDIRSPLCRMTAHLAFARALGGSTDTTALLADALLDTLMVRQAAALEKLARLENRDPRCAAWIRTLKACNTGDYRALATIKSPTRLERIAWFQTYGCSVDVDLAWNALDEEEATKTPAFCRFANASDFSVSTGHALHAMSIPLELRETAQVHEAVLGRALDPAQAIAQLNVEPDRCLSKGTAGAPEVHVIGWGQWAAFLQRHLCHAVASNFNFLQYRWGVPEKARQFSRDTDEAFGGLTLHPFVRRFNCVDEAAYRKSVDDGFALTVAMPHRVSPLCWNYLCRPVSFAPAYSPVPNPHINEWHYHNPPPGTVYNSFPRTTHPSLMSRPDTTAQLEALHALAPHEPTIAHALVHAKYKDAGTYDQLLEIHRPSIEYSVRAMLDTAEAAKGNPDEYEKLVSKAALLNPACYYTLSSYFMARNDEARTARYLAKGIELGPDHVQAANEAGWLIRYHLSRGEVEQARSLADMAGRVYSSRGLRAKGEFLEATNDYKGALEWFAKIEERYGSSDDVIAFCLRYKNKIGDGKFDGELKKRMPILFPKGIEKVSLGDFSGPPADGVVIQGENELLHKAGLNRGDVIVALYGIRVHDLPQYTYGRDSTTGTTLDLIVWKNGRYIEVHTDPPNRRFGLNFASYPDR